MPSGDARSLRSLACGADAPLAESIGGLRIGDARSLRSLACGADAPLRWLKWGAARKALSLTELNVVALCPPLSRALTAPGSLTGGRLKPAR